MENPAFGLIRACLQRRGATKAEFINPSFVEMLPVAGKKKFARSGCATTAFGDRVPARSNVSAHSARQA